MAEGGVRPKLVVGNTYPSSNIRRRTPQSVANCFKSTIRDANSTITDGKNKVIPMNEPLPFILLKYSDCVDVPPNMRSEKYQFPVDPRHIRARLDTAQSRKLIELGFKKPLLAQVIGERLAETGDDFGGFVEYFLAVKIAEDIISGGVVDSLKNYYDKMVERLANPASLVEQKSAKSKATSPDSNKEPKLTTSPSKRAFATNNDESTNMDDTSCKGKDNCCVCMSAEVDMLMMPCRHFLTCHTCAGEVSECPFCRKTIEYTIKVFK